MEVACASEQIALGSPHLSPTACIVVINDSISNLIPIIAGSLAIITDTAYCLSDTAYTVKDTAAFLSFEDWMKESDTAIRSYVTKPKVYDEAIHVRAKAGTKSRIDALRGSTRQGDFVRELIEEGLERREHGANAQNKS
ncbi:MAG: hypothetical protein ABI668_13015 [Sphingorhabdus sp.]